jgi:hypothetical protein
MSPASALKGIYLGTMQAIQPRLLLLISLQLHVNLRIIQTPHLTLYCGRLRFNEEVCKISSLLIERWSLMSEVWSRVATTGS